LSNLILFARISKYKQEGLVEQKIIISPDGKSISTKEMEDIFERGGAYYETIFRRLEFNEVIKYIKAVGFDIGCGLNKIHSCAIGIDYRLGDMDFGYPFGANIKCSKNKEHLQLPFFSDESMDFAFSSHCLEHLSNPRKSIQEMLRVLKPGGYLALILPDMRYYPHKGEPGANPDHEWDCHPSTLIEMIKGIGECELVQIDTLHSKLEDVRLTERDRRIADYYGHSSLNFSFEGVFQKKGR